MENFDGSLFSASDEEDTNGKTFTVSALIHCYADGSTPKVSPSNRTSKTVQHNPQKKTVRKTRHSIETPPKRVLRSHTKAQLAPETHIKYINIKDLTAPYANQLLDLIQSSIDLEQSECDIKDSYRKKKNLKPKQKTAKRTVKKVPKVESQSSVAESEITVLNESTAGPAWETKQFEHLLNITKEHLNINMQLTEILLDMWQVMPKPPEVHAIIQVLNDIVHIINIHNEGN